MASTDNSASTPDQEQLILRDVRIVTFDGREKSLGHGGHTASPVIELEYKGLKCAGQRIRKRNSQGEDQSAGSIKERQALFEKECCILSRIRHPNIVQFLGVFYQEGTERAPILVMEFLPTDLTSCIEKHGILPKEISYSILHDVALGLCYLHGQTPPIIHRDLYSNNILLTSSMTAKISDLGKAKILTNMKATTRMIVTGTSDKFYFMAPEAMVDNPEYDTSIDRFSYGMIMIHVLSGWWPTPLVESVCTDCDGTMIAVSEAKRRDKYLQTIGENHPGLVDFIEKCIHNYPQSRPHASEIVGRLAEMVLKLPASVNRLELLRQHSKEVDELRAKLTEEHSKAVDKLKAKLAQYVDKDKTMDLTTAAKDNATAQNDATAHEKEVVTPAKDPDDSQGSGTDSLQQSVSSRSSKTVQISREVSSTSDDSNLPGCSRLYESEKLDLKNVQKLLYNKGANMWEDIGIQLGIEDGQLTSIKTNYTNNGNACLREMLRVWLKRVNPPPSWSDLAEALDTLGNEDIASQIRKK